MLRSLFQISLIHLLIVTVAASIVEEADDVTLLALQTSWQTLRRELVGERQFTPALLQDNIRANDSESWWIFGRQSSESNEQAGVPEFLRLHGLDGTVQAGSVGLQLCGLYRLEPNEANGFPVWRSVDSQDALDSLYIYSGRSEQRWFIKLGPDFSRDRGLLKSLGLHKGHSPDHVPRWQRWTGAQWALDESIHFSREEPTDDPFSQPSSGPSLGPAEVF